MAVVGESIATDCVHHGGGGEEIRGLENCKQLVSEEFSAFPDMHMTFDDSIVEGDRVAVRFTLTDTHKGKFMGIPPANNKITIWAITTKCIVGGKIVEEWEKTDTLGLMQQLGVVPTPKT